MAMIDSILETARRLQLDRHSRELDEFYRAFMRDHPDTRVGRDHGSFDATVNFHTINMPSRFPDARSPRGPARWLDHPLFKRVGTGSYKLLTDAELRWFGEAVRRNDPVVWRPEYEVPAIDDALRFLGSEGQDDRGPSRGDGFPR